MWLYRPASGRFFDATRREQIDVLFEAILPGDERAPGARDAGAGEYLDRLLAMDASTYYEIPNWQALYNAALPAMDAAARGQFGKGLEDLTAEEATGLLGQLAAGSVAGFPAELDQKSLFATIRAHCIEGCFADPRWGGNKEETMWRWYGYIRPATAYQRPHPVSGPGGQP